MLLNNKYRAAWCP